MENPLLKVTDLEVSFDTPAGKIEAINGISFEIGRGESLGIVGESGSGKSVTALSIMGLLPPNAHRAHGTIEFWANSTKASLHELNEREFQKLRGSSMGMVFQEPMTSLNPVMKCGNQVAEVLLRHFPVTSSGAEAKAMELLERIVREDPERIFHSYPHQLSGGQKQRIMIAMAVCCHPGLLIADEPTTALDVTTQANILNLLKEIQKESSLSILYISHDLGVVARICQKVAVMMNGRIVEQGSIEQVFHQPQHPYTKGLLACRPPIHSRPRRLPTIKEFINIHQHDSTGEGEESSSGRNQEVISEAELSERLESLKKDAPLLRVSGLNAAFTSGSFLSLKKAKKVHAVTDMNFEVYRGETLGIVGESGSGKTTLGRTILNLVKADSGAVWFEGRNILTSSEAEWKQLRKDLQIIFQDSYSALNPKQTIREILTEPMKVHRIGPDARSRIDKAALLLQTVGLEADHLNRYPNEFSGGQRQRICIARALAVEPRLIICDESVSSLDVSIQAQILNLLLDLREKFNLTYLFISHDLAVVKFISDRILVLKEGRLVESGTSEEIYRHPKRDYTRRLISSVSTKPLGGDS